MIPLSDLFFNPELLYTPGNLDKFLIGLAAQPRQKFDNLFTLRVHTMSVHHNGTVDI